LADDDFMEESPTKMGGRRPGLDWGRGMPSGWNSFLDSSPSSTFGRGVKADGTRRVHQLDLMNPVPRPVAPKVFACAKNGDGQQAKREEKPQKSVNGRQPRRSRLKYPRNGKLLLLSPPDPIHSNPWLLFLSMCGASSPLLPVSLASPFTLCPAPSPYSDE
jgi:hypothetical protein